MHFNDISVRQLSFAENGQIKYRDDSLPGFGLLVGKRTKTFFVMYGKERKTKTLGKYPDVCLKDARNEAKRILSGKPQLNSTTGLADARTAFLEDCKARGLRDTTIDRYKCSLQTLPDTQLDKIDTKITEPNLLKAVKVFYNWCIDHELTDRNPFIRRKVVFGKRERLLTDEEVAKIWRYDHKPYSDIVKALLLSGQRRNQIWRYEPEWKTGDIITFPSWIMKSNQPHALPVTGYIDYLYPSSFNSWSKSKMRMDKHTGVEDWVLHDLRRYFSTTMAKLGTPLHITEKLLDHRGRLGGVAGIYNLYTFLDEMKTALLLFEQHVKKLV